MLLRRWHGLPIDDSRRCKERQYNRSINTCLLTYDLSFDAIWRGSSSACVRQVAQTGVRDPIRIRELALEQIGAAPAK
jgi:hypothetical protein